MDTPSEEKEMITPNATGNGGCDVKTNLENSSRASLVSPQDALADV